MIQHRHTVSGRVRLLRSWAPCAGSCIILLLLGFLLFPSAGRDDTHITAWPAHTLARYGEMVNYNGDRIEQSSSLLQVLLVAALSLATSLDAATLCKLVSIFFGVGSVVAVFVLAERSASRSAASSASLLTSLSAFFIYWSFGGMESTMVSFTGICVIITAADYLTTRTGWSLWRPALAIAIFLPVRPEAPVLLGCVLVCAIILVALKSTVSWKAATTRKPLLMRLLVLLCVWFAMTCVVVAFRYWYFGETFPQPVGAKFAGASLSTMQHGFLYVRNNLLGLSGDNTIMLAILTVVIAGSLAILFTEITATEFNIYSLLSLLYVAGYLMFAILSGGDWMEGGRFLVFFVPVIMAFVPIAIARLTKSLALLAIVTTIVAGCQVATLIEFARYSSTGMPLWAAPVDTSGTPDYSWFERRNRINLRDAPVINHLDRLVTQIAKHKKEPVIIMSGQMGIVPYHLSMKHRGDVRFMDRFGLTDRTFTTSEATMGLQRGRLGLQLSYETYFANRNAMEATGNILRPDIIFDIGSANDSRAADNGYTIVYSQSGRIVSDSMWLTGRDVPADEFIAVRTDLLGYLDDPKPIVLNLGT